MKRRSEETVDECLRKRFPTFRVKLKPNVQVPPFYMVTFYIHLPPLTKKAHSKKGTFSFSCTFHPWELVL